MWRRGLPAAPGVGIGRAWVWAEAEAEAGAGSVATALIPSALPGAEPAHERARVEGAIASVRQELAGALDGAANLAPQAAEIIAAHLGMLADPELIDAISQQVDGGATAEAAVQTATQHWSALLRQVDDAYIRARAADVEDVAARILRALAGRTVGAVPAAPQIGAGEAVVVVAREIWPSQVLALDPARVAGIVTADGSPSSHAAQLARAAGIPAVMGVGPLAGVGGPPSDTWLGIDGDSGEVVVATGPEAPELEPLRARRQRWQVEQAEWAALNGQSAVTRDGALRVALLANIGAPDEVAFALRAGAEGIGLMRSEYLWMQVGGPPTVARQEAAYRQVLTALAPRLVTIRLLDAGADKRPAGLNLPSEVNPALGVRGVRLLLQQPDVLTGQLEALCRAAPSGRLQVLVPMVATAAELHAVRQALTAVAHRLRTAGVTVPALRLGAMVEIPALALAVDTLAGVADFISLGTSDLIQYGLATDRTNPVVAATGDWRHPGLARLVAQAVAGARTVGIDVAVCGDLAADSVAAVALAGLGVHELSMAPAAIPRVKAALRAVTRAEAEAAAREWLAQGPGAR